MEIAITLIILAALYGLVWLWRRWAWPAFKAAATPTADWGPVKDLLFADQTLAEMAAAGDADSPFGQAQQCVLAGHTAEAQGILQEITNDSETRMRLCAWRALRELGVASPPALSQEVYGVVLEVPAGNWVDTIAAYADGTARYLNGDGGAMLWDVPGPSQMSDLVNNVIVAARPLLSQAAVCQRHQPESGEVARATLLTYGGLRVMEARPDEILTGPPHVIAAGSGRKAAAGPWHSAGRLKMGQPLFRSIVCRIFSGGETMMPTTLKQALRLTLLLCLAAPAAFAQEKPELYLQTGHSGRVNSVAFSPDGKTLASGSNDKTIKLWDVTTGQELRTLAGHSGGVNSVAFSPDGKILASASGFGDTTIKLWDIVNGQELRTLKGHSSFVSSVAFSPDGKMLASGSWDNTIKLWDVTTGQELRTLAGHSHIVYSIAFSPDGRMLASSSLDKTVKLWNVANGQELRAFTGYTPLDRPITGTGIHPAVMFSPDGKTLALANRADKTIKMWDVTTGQELRTLTGHKNYVNSVAFSPDGKTLASSSDDNTIKLWDVNNGQELRTLALTTRGNPVALAFSPDGKTLASGSGDDTIKLWNVTNGQELRTLTRHSRYLRSWFSPDGKMLVGVSGGNTIKQWDLTNGQELRTLASHTLDVSNAEISPDGKILASFTNSFDKGTTIKLWDVASGQVLRTFSSPVFVGSVIFSPDGKILAILTAGYILNGKLTDEDKTIKLWDVASGRELRIFTGHSGVVFSVAFSPDGKVLASRSVYSTIVDKTIKLWDVATGQELRTLTGHSGGVNSVAFSPDGKILASGSSDKTIKLWDVVNGQELRTLTDPTNSVSPVAFSPDGKTLASGGWKTIKLWDVASGQELRTLTGHSSGVSSIEFSPDGKTLLAGSIGDATQRLWDVASGRELIKLVALDERDWAVFTPDGRFDASAGAMKLLFFRQNNQILPLESFFEQFYTPGLLAQAYNRRLPPLPKNVADFSKTIKLPPTVRIVSPQAGAAFDADAAQVVVEATDQGGGVDEIRLYQNGKLVAATDRKILQEEARQLGLAARKSKTFNVTLLPGVNNFRAVAFNRERTESLPADTAVELKAAQATANLYLLAVGLNEYKNAKYNLNYGRADAQAFADAVEQRGRKIFKQIIKHTLFDSAATHANIEAAFAAVIKQARPQDVFVFFYAGHGAMSDGDATTPADFYLVPHDVTSIYGDSGGLTQRGISAKRLRELCFGVKAQKQLIVLDACQSGGAVETFAGSRGTAEEKAMAQLARAVGVAVLASAGQDQFATEFKALGHGAFTYALLQGLGGEADGGARDGKITVQELAAYLGDKLPELTKQFRGKTQYPNSWTRGQDFPLGVN